MPSPLGVFLNITTHEREEIERRIAFVQSLPGMHHVEVWLEHGLWNDDDSRWLRQKLEGKTILVHAPFINFTLVARHDSINQASLRELEKASDQAALLGAKVMTVHIGRKPNYLSDEQARELAISYLTSLLAYVRGRFLLAIENLPPTTGTTLRYPVTLAESAKILDAVPGLMMTVDIGHCIQNNEPYAEFFSSYAPRIANVHVHNAEKRGRAHFGFTEKGDLDLSKLKNLLDRVGYKGYISIEVMGEEAIQASSAKALEIWPRKLPR